MSVNLELFVKIHAAICAAGRPLAIHEFDIKDVSQNNLGTRLPEIARDTGWLIGLHRVGQPFKEWDVTAGGEQAIKDLAANAARTPGE